MAVISDRVLYPIFCFPLNSQVLAMLVEYAT